MELEKMLEKYAKKFGEGFPMCPLGWDKDEDEIIELINKCFKAGKSAYDLGLVEVPSAEIMY